jgi:hypothetical protein
MNEIERYFSQKNDSIAKAISEMAKDLRINNPLLF